MVGVSSGDCTACAETTVPPQRSQPLSVLPPDIPAHALMARSVRPLNDRNNSGDAQMTPVKVKAERKVKEEPKRDKGKRRAETEPEDDDGAEGAGDDERDEENDDEEGGSPKGRKRARANTNGDSRPAGEDAPKKRVTTLPRDVDGCVA